jgi:Uma2 family endonuclease
MSIKPEIYIYIDPRVEEDMPESDEHAVLIEQLRPLLKWLYRERDWFIAGNLLILQTTATAIRQSSPDIVIFKGVQKPVAETTLSSWKVGEANRPAPALVIEVASEATWRHDLNEKVTEYGLLGVREYLTYDPNVPPLWGKQNRRLRGWRYDAVGTAQVVEVDGRGWLWSAELEAWLEPDGRSLHLCSRGGERLLTETETTRRVAQMERRAARQAKRTVRQAEQVAREAEQAARQAEQVARETEQRKDQQIQELKARLRELEGGKSGLV